MESNETVGDLQKWLDPQSPFSSPENAAYSMECPVEDDSGKIASGQLQHSRYAGCVVIGSTVDFGFSSEQGSFRLRSLNGHSERQSLPRIDLVLRGLLSIQDVVPHDFVHECHPHRCGVAYARGLASADAAYS